MGTNFYLGKKNIDNSDPEYHIGKRSAAGMYCWDCKRSLCKHGAGRVHYSDYNEWYDSCPQCGKKSKGEPIEKSTVGRELGFNETKPGKKTGVASCSSFTWAMPPERFESRRHHIYDEYGRRFTRKEFDKILEECPIQFFNHIGNEFS